MMVEKSPRVGFSDRKISETILAFAEPQLRDLPKEGRIQRVEKALKVAQLVWNAVVLADVLGEKRYLAEARRLMKATSADSTIVEDLVRRKRVVFAEDARLIATVEVRKTTEGFKVQARSSDPFSLPGRSDGEQAPRRK